MADKTGLKIQNINPIIIKNRLIEIMAMLTLNTLPNFLKKSNEYDHFQVEILFFDPVF